MKPLLAGEQPAISVPELIGWMPVVWMRHEHMLSADQPSRGVPELIGWMPVVWMRHARMSAGQSTSSALSVTQTW
jgi:hypothetical protein